MGDEIPNGGEAQSDETFTDSTERGSDPHDELIAKFKDDAELRTEDDEQIDDDLSDSHESTAVLVADLGRKISLPRIKGMDLGLNESVSSVIKMNGLMEKYSKAFEQQQRLSESIKPMKAFEDAFKPYLAMQKSLEPMQRVSKALDFKPPAAVAMRSLEDPLSGLNATFEAIRSDRIEKEEAVRRSQDTLEELRDKTVELVESQTVQIQHLESVNRALLEANQRNEIALVEARSEAQRQREELVNERAEAKRNNRINFLLVLIAVVVAVCAWLFPRAAPEAPKAIAGKTIAPQSQPSKQPALIPRKK